MRLTVIVALVIITAILTSCSSKPQAEDIVKIYYESLNNKDYKMMYWSISDGFKEIDPNAKDLETFTEYMKKFYEDADGVRVQRLHETSNDGKKAQVSYLIIIIGKDGSENPYTGKFTLKNQANGWKLIHPYGENIDTSG